MAIFCWQDMTSPELAKAIAASGERAVAVLPVAAIEQHGPHLPLSTDAEIAAACLSKLPHMTSENAEIYLLPLLPYGASREHTSFPGTLSISGETFYHAMLDLGRSLARSGIQKLILLSSHGGNSHWLAEAALTLRHELGMLVVVTSWLRLAEPISELPEGEVKSGIHGGAEEVALMRHLRPEHVREDKVASFARADAKLPLEAGGRSGFAWMAEDLNSQGVVGDGRLGTPEIGKAIAERALEGLTGKAAQMAALDWQGRAGKTSR